MTHPFETIDLNQTEQQLKVEINRDGWDITTADNFTHISAEPPFQKEELLEARKMLDGEPAGYVLNRLVRAGLDEDPEGGVTLTLDGKIDEDKVKFGLAITEEVMSMRGLEAAIVKVDSSEPTHIVRRKSDAELAGAHVTVIDADEFAAGVEADKNDPQWQALLQSAREMADIRADAEYRARHTNEIQIVSATDTSAAIRSPKTGKLYGVTMTETADGDEEMEIIEVRYNPNVTELTLEEISPTEAQE